ncbi:MAG: hypothetical protein ACSHXW_04395 [Yoonia sp.]
MDNIADELIEALEYETELKTPSQKAAMLLNCASKMTEAAAFELAGRIGTSTISSLLLYSHELAKFSEKIEQQ